MIKFATVAAVAALAATPAFACSSCGCSLTSDWLAQGLVTIPGTTLTLRYDDVPQTSLQSGRHEIAPGSIALPSDREVEHYTYNHYVTATLDHQFAGDWGVDLQVPAIYRPHLTTSPGDTAVSSSHSGGLGDVRLTARWQGFGGDGITGIQFGLKLPTGSFHEHFIGGPSAGEEFDRGLQPGTGTTDALVGAYHYGRLGAKFDVILQALAQIPLDSRDLYRPSIAGNLSAGFHYTGWRGITPQLQVNFRIAGRDAGENADRENSGGELLYVAPGATFRVTPRVSAFAYAQVPVYQRVIGLQLTPRYTASVGVNYRL